MRMSVLAPTRCLALAILLSVLAVSCGGGNGEEAAGTPASSLELIAEDISFDMKTLTIEAGRETTVTFENKDGGVLHNLAIYEDESAGSVLFRGDFVTGPNTTTYTFEAPAPGTYFFRCDSHPNQMTGSLIVR